MLLLISAFATVIFPVEAAFTESLMSNACFIPSTYALVAASCACVGSLTFTTLYEFASIMLEVGLSERLPEEVEISCPFISTLSISNAPPVIVPEVVIAPLNPVKAVTVFPKLTVWPPNVIELFASLLFAIVPVAI